MALLDFIKNRNASLQQSPVAQTQQPTPALQPPARPVRSLPAEVKTQAVEAARPAAQLMNEAATPKSDPAPRPEGNQPGRGRSPGMER